MHKNNIFLLYLSEFYNSDKLSKKDKVKDQKKDKKKKKNKEIVLESIKKIENCKSTCCEKFKKSEKKRCSRCPMYDLMKNIA